MTNGRSGSVISESPDCQREQRATTIVTAAALIFFAAIETWGAFLPVTYDEPWYLDTVAGIDLHGAVSYVFIRDFPGPTGPLHAWLHWLLRPITHLEPPLVRVVNPLLAALATCATAVAIRKTRGNSPWGTALLISAVPMAWPCVGMALTEVPAMLLYSVHLLLLLTGWDEGSSRTRSITWSILSGVAIGLAILGRQPLLLTLAGVMACGMLERRRLLNATVCCAAALVICVPVFMIWGGLTPQTMAGNVAARRQAGLVIYGLVPWHIAYAMAYSGITVAIVAPRCVDARWRAWALVVAACMAVCIIFRVKGGLPLQSVIGAVVPLTLRWVVEAACSGAMLGLALCFGMSLMAALWRHRTDTVVVLGVLTILTQVLAAGAVRHQFSSRYLFATTPVVLLMASRFLPVSTSPLRAGIGATLGAASLLSYFRIAYNAAVH